MLYYGILALNCVICVFLIAVVLLQRSEGGALGGGGPTGLVTTRGAGDLLTRTTWILFAIFLILSLSLTLLGGRERSSQAIINRLKLQSINPDTLAKRPAGPATPGQAAPAGATPGEATPPPVQAPATAAGAPTPSVRLPASTPAPAPASAPLDFSTPAPVVNLPPMPMAPKPSKP